MEPESAPLRGSKEFVDDAQQGDTYLVEPIPDSQNRTSIRGLFIQLAHAGKLKNISGDKWDLEWMVIDNRSENAPLRNLLRDIDVPAHSEFLFVLASRNDRDELRGDLVGDFVLSREPLLQPTYVVFIERHCPYLS